MLTKELILPATKTCTLHCCTGCQCALHFRLNQCERQTSCIYSWKIKTLVVNHVIMFTNELTCQLLLLFHWHFWHCKEKEFVEGPWNRCTITVCLVWTSFKSSLIAVTSHLFLLLGFLGVKLLGSVIFHCLLLPWHHWSNILLNKVIFEMFASHCPPLFAIFCAQNVLLMSKSN